MFVSISLSHTHARTYGPLEAANSTCMYLWTYKPKDWVCACTTDLESTPPPPIFSHLKKFGEAVKQSKLFCGHVNPTCSFHGPINGYFLDVKYGESISKFDKHKRIASLSLLCLFQILFWFVYGHRLRKIEINLLLVNFHKNEK